MRVTYFGIQTDNFDYSEYERKLRNITSVPLLNINDLQKNHIEIIENSFVQMAKAYFDQIEQLLKEISEEV